MPCGRIEAVSWPDHLILMADSAGQRPRLIGIKAVCHKCKQLRYYRIRAKSFTEALTLDALHFINF